MKKDMLVKIATQFREAITSIPQSKFPEECQLHHSFPDGACGNTSMLLGKYLLEKFHIDCDYMRGWDLREGKEQYTHAWLECEGYKIDITADQFDEVHETVIVAQSHELYGNYKHDKPKKISSELFTEEFDHVYDMIVSELKD